MSRPVVVRRRIFDPDPRVFAIYVWEIKVNGVVVGMFETGKRALVHVNREMTNWYRQQAQEQAKARFAQQILANLGLK
jgi:hypothetical protein